jgi:hypothetical protein
MRAEAEPKPHSRRNESACGAPVARSRAWVGPFRNNCDVQVSLPEGAGRLFDHQPLSVLPSEE